MNLESGTPILVTTKHRGVFFGRYVTREGDDVTVTDGRNCVYWSQSTRGFLGLAVEGPNSECRIGPKVPELELRGVTSIAACTDEAVEAWEKAPWS